MGDVLAPDLPRSVQVEVTGACNLACAMCLVSYRPRIGRQTGAMCFHTFRSVVDALPNLERLTLQGLGEPLLAPDLERMVRYAAGRGAAVGFNSNGMLLTPERSRRLVRAGLSWLHVSLDGATRETYESIRHGADFELVCEHVASLVRVRGQLGVGRPRISLVFVAMRRNVDELPDLVGLAHALGVDRLWVQNLSHSFSDTDPAGEYADIRRFATEQALWTEDDEVRARARMDEAACIAADVGIELRLPELDGAPAGPADGPACEWPFTSAYVTHRGEVQPCCMVMGADRAILGDVGEASLADIWKSDGYRSFRDGLLAGPPPSVCVGCALYRGVF
jgi:MoaA/NifB/PqqE/SkfB family radical SAM enzyme